MEEQDTRLEKPDNLTMKQWLFCLEYVKDFNATAAAKRAKYSATSAKVIGSENLTKPAVKAYIKYLMQFSIMGPEELLSHLTSIARGEWGQYMQKNGKLNIGGLVRDGKAHLIQKITNNQQGLSYHFPSRLEALRLIGSNLQGGMWTDKQDVTNREEQLTKEQQIAKLRGILDELENG